MSFLTIVRPRATAVGGAHLGLGCVYIRILLCGLACGLQSTSLVSQCKFRHRRSIRRPRFPIRVQNFSDLAMFSVDFCILYSECPPYFYFRFV